MKKSKKSRKRFTTNKYVHEQKYGMEQSVKKYRTNEKVFTDEMEHLRLRLDKYENNSMPDKDKLIASLNTQILQVCLHIYTDIM
jgi:hypothetical protein